MSSLNSAKLKRGMSGDKDVPFCFKLIKAASAAAARDVMAGNMAMEKFYAGLQASARDWLQLGILITQNNGEIVPRSAVETLLTPSSLNTGYGLGVWLGSPEDGTREYGPSTALAVPSAEPFILQDTAFIDGFGGQRVYIFQSAELVIVRIGDVRFDWDDTALPNLAAKALGLK